jgi:hypothetical protein
MTAPNIVSVATITGKTAVLAVTTSATAIVTNAGSSGKVLKLNALIVANIDGSNNCEVTCDLYRSSVAYHIAKTIDIPADTSLAILDKAIYLEEGDSLRLTAEASSDLQAVCSYEEIS